MYFASGMQPIAVQSTIIVFFLSDKTDGGGAGRGDFLLKMASHSLFVVVLAATGIRDIMTPVDVWQLLVEFL